MKIAIIYNKDHNGVINRFGMQNKETYNPRTVGYVADALEAGGHNVEIIDGNMHVIERLQEFMPKVLDGEQMGMVFNMAYGIQGESRYTHIPSMLEMLGIPYVGSSPSGHALALDKVITKIIMQKHGIPTPEFWVFSDQDEDLSAVPYPAIVKPKMESVSFGLRVVNNVEQLREAIKYTTEEYKQQALVERFIRGREFAVGLLGNNPVETFPVLEFDLNNDPDAIQSVEDKRNRPRPKICPAQLSDELTKKMIDYSVTAFKALQLRDFARVDIRLDQNNNIYLLEINSMASLGRTGSYTHAASVAGYDYKALVNKMLDVAVVRYFANTSLMLENETSQQKIPLQTRIRGFLRSRQENLENLLQQMVNINTYTRNSQGVNELSSIVKKYLSVLNFTCEVIPQVEVGNIHFYTNTDSDEYDILLIGSFDNWKKVQEQEYFQITDQKIFGTGVWENKGGLVVMLAALQALRFVRLLRRMKIAILFSTDSTLQGKFIKPIIEQKTPKARWIFGLHGGGINGTVVTSRSGSSVYKCDMNLMQTENANDVAEATGVFSKFISSVIDFSDAERGLVIAPYKVDISSNITQPYAHGEVTFSIRFSENELIDETDQRIKRLTSKKYKVPLHIQIEGSMRRPAMKHTENIALLWQIVKDMAKKLDIQLREEHRWSSADICFADESKCMIDGMGPVGLKPVKKTEFILRHSLLERATLLAMTLNELCCK